MAWVLRLIETGADGQGRSIDVLEISRPNTLHDIAGLGLTLRSRRGRDALARALPLDTGAGPAAGTPVRAPDLPCRGRRAGALAAGRGWEEPRDVPQPHAQAR